MKGRTIRTQKKREAFLAALRISANVAEAAAAAGMSRNAAYMWRDDDTKFAAEWKEAVDVAVDQLEREAWRRASEGWDEPKFYEGEVCGHVRKYSDTLLIFMLKAKRPDEFKDRVENQLTGKDGAPLQPVVNVRIDK